MQIKALSKRFALLTTLVVLAIVAPAVILLSVGLLLLAADPLPGDDDGVKEFVAMDVTKSPDAMDFVGAMKKHFGEWINRGVGHELYDEKSGVVWDKKKDGSIDIKGEEEPNIKQSDVETAGWAPNGKNENQADILYLAAHGSGKDGSIFYGVHGARYKYIVLDPLRFKEWRADLEWAIFAICGVLKVEFEDGRPTGGPGLEWARTLKVGTAHGILGYRGIAPSAPTDSKIAEAFIENLKNGQTFIEAWRNANEEWGRRAEWAIIVNENFRGEKLGDLSTERAKDKPGRIFYYDDDHKQGVDITEAVRL